MDVKEIKNMRFLGQVKEIVIFFADPGWFLAVRTDVYQEYVKLMTARGEVRIFKTLDAANKSAVEILRQDPSHLLDEEQRAVPQVRIVN